MNRDQFLEVLREIRFLHDMGPMHLEQIANVSRFRDYREGDTVFRQGDAAQHVYLIATGKVSLEICGAGVGCKQILTLGPGELLGWSSVLEQTCYTARARALESTRLVEIDDGQLLTLCERDPQFGFEWMRRTALALAKRLGATRMQLLDVYGDQIPAMPMEGGTG